MKLTFATPSIIFIMTTALYSGAMAGGGAKVKTIEPQCKGELLSPTIQIYVASLEKTDAFYLPKHWQGKFVFVEKDPRLTSADIELIEKPINNVFKILFTSKGTEKVAEATRGNRGKLLMFIVDKQIVFAPEIKDEMAGKEASITDLVLSDGKTTLFRKMCLAPKPKVITKPEYQSD